MLNALKHLFKTGFFHIFTSDIINKIISFGSTLLLVRILTKDEYGIFVYAWNIYSLVMLFSGCGLASGVLQLCSENFKNKIICQNILIYSIKNGVLCNLIIGLILCLIAFAMPLSISSARKLILLLVLLPTLQIVYSIIISYLRSQKYNKQFAELNLCNTFCIFVFTIIGAYFFKEAGLVLGYYIAFLVTIFLVKKYFPFILVGLRENKGKLIDKVSLLKISFISMCNNAISELLYIFDIFIIGIIIAEENIIANYKVATIIPFALMFIPAAIVNYVYPYFAENRLNKLWCLSRFNKLLITLLILNFLISLFLFVFAPFILKILFGEQYVSATDVFRILSLNYFIGGTFRILSGNLLVTQRKLKFNLIVAILCGMVNIVGDYYFVGLYGYAAAAWVTVVVTFISSFLSTGYLYYIYRNDEQSN